MPRKLPSIQALCCFEAAARHKSFTRAAQELSLTQGAVSRQVASLEEMVGMALFRRTQHGMSLTSGGELYAPQVRQRLNALERDTQDLMGRSAEGDSISLACVPTFASRWLIPRLPRLAKLHPNLQVHIESRARPFLFSELEVDAAVFAGTPEQLAKWTGIEAQCLLDEEVVPVCSPALLPDGLALAADQLAKLPRLQQSTRPEAWREWFEAQGVSVPDAMVGPRYELFSMQAEAAAVGLGVALMPTLLIQKELQSGTLVVACAHTLQSQRRYYWVQPVATERPAVALLRAWLEQEAKTCRS